MPQIKQLVLTPRSSFLRIKCPKCGMERIVFSHSKRRIYCEGCGELLVIPTGGKAIINSQEIKKVD
ncbi:MAG: 30S ribosomal protein S27e [Nitrososphaeria archaeon]|jgi:small subunit ribosomal protein S27e